MSDLTDNWFYPPTERIWCLNNASLSGPTIDLQKMPILAKKIIFSYEAHFHLDGVNKQNYRNWGTENQHAYIEKPILVQRHNWAIFLLVHKTLRGEYWQHLVSIGRRHVPHSRSYTRCFAPWF